MRSAIFFFLYISVFKSFLYTARYAYIFTAKGFCLMNIHCNKFYHRLGRTSKVMAK